MKTFAELQSECSRLGLSVPCTRRPSKEPYIAALRQHHWQASHSDEPLPPMILPMLLDDWGSLALSEAEQMEQDGNGWIVQPKLDGVRALFHIDQVGIRITGRCISEVTYRLGEFQDNVPHLAAGLNDLAGTIMDGELVCPVTEIDTGKCRTAHPLQAAVAILGTDPDKAREIQERQNAYLRFHAFDVLQFRGQDTTVLPLLDRQDVVGQIFARISNPFLEAVPNFVLNKAGVHEQAIRSGAEGTVWKRLDQPYEPGKRVRHWIKRKRSVEMVGFISGWKPGDPGNGHAHLVGAVEFSTQDAEGTARPVAWVSGWSDRDRQAMTRHAPDGSCQLDSAYLGRRARICGLEPSSRSQRLRHARFCGWLDA